MVDFYSDMQGIASGLLTEFKQGVTRFIALTPGIGSPDNPGTPIETIHDFDGTVRGVRFRYIDGSQIFATDIQTTAPGTLPIADATGFLEVDGKRFKVIKVIAKPAAGLPVTFDIIARK
jgi:hypothetical protein